MRRRRIRRLRGRRAHRGCAVEPERRCAPCRAGIGCASGARPRDRPLADRGLRNGGEAPRRQENDAQDAAGTARKRAAVRALRLCPARGRGASGVRDADDGADGEGSRVMDVIAPVSAPGRLRIDLAALADNWRDTCAPRRAGALRRRRQGQRLRDRRLGSCAGAVGRGRARLLCRPFQRGDRGAAGAAGGGRDLCAQRPRERGRAGGLCRASARARDRRRRGA